MGIGEGRRREAVRETFGKERAHAMCWKRSIAFVASSLLVCACGGMLRADAGAIPYVMYVNVFEPDQRAFIAWGGQEEILILSTDLYASEPTKVLEVVPMPSEPKVTAGDTKIFKRAVDLMNKKLPKRRVVAMPAGTGTEKVETEVPAVAEVTFHEKIGATDVSVVHVLARKDFITWVEKYLKGQKAQSPAIPEIMKKTVQEYLDDGYGWFAFNVVSLGKEVKSKEAVQYRFKTDCLFYPMRISRTDKGQTHISLTVLTRDAFDNNTVVGVPEGWLSVSDAVVTASGPEVAGISRECYQLLGKPREAKIRVWATSGKLESFNQDIVAGKERSFSFKRDKTGEVFGPFPLKPDTKMQIGQGFFKLLAGKDRVQSSSDSLNNAVPMQIVLLREGTPEKPEPFDFVDGTKGVLAGEQFTLQIKGPVAKDPTFKGEPSPKQ